MKNLILRSGLTLACALSLAACGGSDGNLEIQVSVIGMSKTGLVLKSGETSIAIPALAPGASTTVVFGGFEADDRYNIQVAAQPEGSACVGRGNVGKMGAYGLYNNEVSFYCYNLPQKLSGKLTKAVDVPIVLNNGNTRVTIPAGQTDFEFTTTDADGKTIGTVGHGEPYGVTVLDANGKTCTVEKGSGTMALGFNGVLVTCQ